MERRVSYNLFAYIFILFFYLGGVLPAANKTYGMMENMEDETKISCPGVYEEGKGKSSLRGLKTKRTRPALFQMIIYSTNVCVQLFIFIFHGLIYCFKVNALFISMNFMTGAAASIVDSTAAATDTAGSTVAADFPLDDTYL